MRIAGPFADRVLLPPNRTGRAPLTMRSIVIFGETGDEHIDRDAGYRHLLAVPRRRRSTMLLLRWRFTASELNTCA